MIKANMPLSAARLLMGSSIAAISLALAAPAFAQIETPPVQVQGEGTGDYTQNTNDLTKLPEPILDTPTSVTTVTQQLMQDRGDTSLTDVFRNVPSITMESSESSWQGNNPYIRGFSARTDMYLDGMRDFGFYTRDPFDLQDVQVLEGPDSILFGRGSTGGIVEQTSKMPTLDGFTNFSLGGGTNNAARATADIDVPIDDIGTPAALRLNVMGNTNGVAGRDMVDYSRYGLAPSLSLGIGTPTRVDVSYLHQSENDRPDFGLPWYFGSPAPVNDSNYYGYSTDHLNANADIATAKVEHDFDDSFTVRDQFRYSDYTRNVVGSKPALPASATPATPLANINLTINSFSLRSTEQQLMNQTDLLAKFDTGFLHHDLDAGFEYDFESSTPAVYNSSGLTNNLVTPNEVQVFNPTATYPRVNIDTTTNTESFYATDTIKLLDQFELVLGGRYDRFSAHFHELVYSVPPATTGVVTATNISNHVDGLPSWHGALVYKPMDNGTVYFTYSTSYNPTAETLDVIQSFTSFSLANEGLDPEKTRNLEVGTKWSVLDDKVMLTGSLFKTDMYNAREPDPAIPTLDILAGDQRVQGYELTGKGWIMDGWNVSLGYDYLDSNTTKTVAGGPPLGFPLPFVARNNLTFWTTYQFWDNFEAGVGGQYLSKRYAQTTAPVESVPGYVTFDAMAKYTINSKFDVQVNLYNIGDEKYYDMLHPAFAVPGATTSAMLTLDYHS